MAISLRDTVSALIPVKFSSPRVAASFLVPLVNFVLSRSDSQVMARSRRKVDDGACIVLYCREVRETAEGALRDGTRRGGSR